MLNFTFLFMLRYWDFFIFAECDLYIVKSWDMKYLAEKDMLLFGWVFFELFTFGMEKYVVHLLMWCLKP